jgi:hypothetical protein
LIIFNSREAGLAGNKKKAADGLTYKKLIRLQHYLFSGAQRQGNKVLKLKVNSRRNLPGALYFVHVRLGNNVGEMFPEFRRVFTLWYLGNNRAVKAEILVSRKRD